MVWGYGEILLDKVMYKMLYITLEDSACSAPPPPFIILQVNYSKQSQFRRWRDIRFLYSFPDIITL